MSSSVEIVTVVEVHFLRLGSASITGPFSNRTPREYREAKVVADDQPQTIRAAVIDIAIAQGEPAAAMRGLTVLPINYAIPKNEHRFDFPSSNVQFAAHYATCTVSAALKIDGRCFKVEEVEV